MTTSEKVAYLKGLAEGFGLTGSDKESKILSTIVDILEDLALDQEDLGAELVELEDGLDAVSEDLEDVEKILFDDIEDDEDYDDEEAEDWDGETVFYEATCPVCGETVTFDEGVLSQGGIQCPTCGEQLEFDMEASAEEQSEQ